MELRVANKMGILWKVRLAEHEISLAEERGPVRTFKVKPDQFDYMRKQGVREGCYIQVVFDFQKRIITSIDFVLLDGYVTKWAPKYAFVHTPVLPQIKLGRNNRVAECKFLHNPPTSLSSTYLNPQILDFQLENNMQVQFALCVALKKSNGLRNPPYMDLTAINVSKMPDGVDDSRRSSVSSMNTAEPESRIDSWLSRRMSNTSSSRGKDEDPGSRKRGGSTPVKTRIKNKRDPSKNRRKESASAPNTPLKEPADVPENLNDLMSTNKNDRTPPLRRPKKESISKMLKEKDSEILAKDAENKRLQLELEQLKKKLLLAESQPSTQQQQPNVSPQSHFSRSRVPESAKASQTRNVSYILDNDDNFGTNSFSRPSHPLCYDNIFSHSPSVSPSSSPTLDLQDPSAFSSFLSCGMPSSTRSDILHSSYDRPFDHSHKFTSTPLIHALDASEYADRTGFGEPKLKTTTPKNNWPSTPDQLTPNEYVAYQQRRRSPKEITDMLNSDYDRVTRGQSSVQSSYPGVAPGRFSKYEPRNGVGLLTEPIMEPIKFGKPPKHVKRSPEKDRHSQNSNPREWSHIVGDFM